MPLMKRIGEGKFTKAGAAKKLNVLSQHITNWLRRGIPATRLHDVADLCGLDTDAYRLEAGLPTARRQPKQGKLATHALVSDFEALPDGLQTYVSRKASELRRLYEGLPVWLREKMEPPKDPAKYREWERDIEALMFKFRGGNE